MKISKLITALLILIGMTAMHNVNAQDSIHVKSKYKCWIYDNPDDMSSSREGVIYSVVDSGINFAASISGNTLKKYDMQLQYIPVTKIDYIDVRKNGSVEKGALIGLGVGGVFSFALLYAAVRNSSSSNWTWSQQPTYHDHADMGPYLFVSGFSIAGAVIGALIGSQKLEFQINRKQNRYKRQKEEIRSYAIIQ